MSDKQRVRIVFTETVYHSVTVQLDKEELDNLISIKSGEQGSTVEMTDLYGDETTIIDGEVSVNDIEIGVLNEDREVVEWLQ